MFCKQSKTTMKPKVAEKIVACLNEKAGTQELCDVATPMKCALEAIKLACPEPGMGELCGEVLERCSPEPVLKEFYEKQTCIQGMSALNPPARKKMAECVRTECKLSVCFQRLLAP